MQNWPAAEVPVVGSIMLTITYFYENISMDVDNLPKPISDALKGLVYVDDEQVPDVLCRKRNRRSVFRIENPSNVLNDGLRRGNEFLYVVVAQAPDQEVI